MVVETHILRTVNLNHAGIVLINLDKTQKDKQILTQTDTPVSPQPSTTTTTTLPPSLHHKILHTVKSLVARIRSQLVSLEVTRLVV